MEPLIDAAGPDLEAGNPLAAALLPVLLHRINNVTQLLTCINAVIALSAAEGDSAAGAARGEDLLAAAADAEELGWLLGVLGCGLGADLLLERREARGLDATVRLVQEALHRERTELVLDPADAWPSLTSEVPSHGDLCWVVAFGLWFAALHGGRLEVALENETKAHVLTCTGAGPVDWSDLRDSLEQRLPGAELRGTSTGWTLHLPAGWLRRDA